MNDPAARAPDLSTIEGRPRPRRRRRAALCILALAAVVGSIVLWRATTLSGLPEIPDPFDVKAYARVEIPESENAYTYYRRSYARFKDVRGRLQHGVWTDWSWVGPSELKYLENSRESLDLWLEGTKKERGVYIQPGEASVETRLPVAQMLRDISKVATLKAFVLQHEGDLAGAWSWIRAALRSGRHSGMNGFLIEGLVGAAIFDTAAQQAVAWSDDPRVDAKLLRGALDDVLALDKIDRRSSQMYRVEYYVGTSGLRDLATCERLRLETASQSENTWRFRLAVRARSAISVLRHEPERSRRVFRLILANWLSACDLTPEERGRRLVTYGRLKLYAPVPGEKPVIDPAELARWYETAIYAQEFFRPEWMPVETYWSFARLERNRANLIVHLAEGLYKREKGKDPSSPQDLVGTYLEAIPSGYDPRIEPQTPKGSAR
jgi:hypothetical protein